MSISHLSLSHHDPKSYEEYVLNDKWVFLDVIANGTFGKIFLAQSIASGEKVAIKVTSLQEAEVQQLRIENDVLKRLKGNFGFPNVHEFGRNLPGGTHFFMVMDFLGPNLEDLFRYCGGIFSMKTICMLAIQMIMQIETMHSKQMIHRDIKPANFAMGRGNDFNIVHLIDFGLSRSYIIPGSDEHIPFLQTRRMMGTARYCSLNSHMGMQLSRRDDMEALGYLFVYFAKGILPWQNIDASNRVERFRLIHQKKAAVTPMELCEGLPQQFVDFVTEAKSLTFPAQPNYIRLRSLFYQIITERRLKYDSNYDWIDVHEKRLKYSLLPRDTMHMDNGSLPLN